MAEPEQRAEMKKDAFALYLKYNGERFDQIESDMHRLGWVGFKRQMLKDKGNGENYRAGWITQGGWENALRLKIAEAQTAAATSAESLLFEAEFIRKEAFIEIQTEGIRASKDIVWQHDKYTRHSIDILAKLNDARDNYANFSYFWAWLAKVAPSVSPALAREMIEAEDGVMERAERDFVVEDDKPE